MTLLPPPCKRGGAFTWLVGSDHLFKGGLCLLIIIFLTINFSRAFGRFLSNAARMSAGAVLDQFSNLVKHMESLDPKLSSKIRPSKEQLEEFQTLTKKLKCATAHIELHVAQLVEKANQRTAPTKHELDLLKSLQSSKLVDKLDNSLRARLGKNLALIFRGPDVSAWDSDKVRSRRDKIRTRCERLRAYDPRLILKWSITFQPSAWNQPTIMAENTFEFLVGKLETEEFGQIPPQIMNILQSLQQEDPFKDCNPYHEFVQKATSTMTGHEVLDAKVRVMSTEHQQQAVIPYKRQHTEHQQQDAVSYKKQCTTESELFGGKPQYDDNHRQEQIMLIKRSKGKQ